MPRPTDSGPAAGARAGRRRDVLAVLRAAPGPLGPADLAERIGVHPNTVRFHLDRLVEAGQVERVSQPPAGRGRPGLAFTAHRGMDASGPRDYRLLAELLADGLGFAPERRPADHGWVVGLRHCPFLEVVRTVGTTVCRAHLGLAQGAMAAMDAPVVVEGLEPFAEPDLCLTTLRGAT